MNSACAACCTAGQERTLDNRQILVLKICSDILQMSPDKVEEADEIASLDENLKNNFSWVVILSEGQRQPGKRC